MDGYEKKHTDVEKAYQEYMARVTCIEFWNKYLELDVL